MFTGIIDHCGKIIEITHAHSFCSISIESQFSDLVLGESIAIDGICLTVTQIKDNVFSCDISSETLAVTTAKNFQLQQKINLERALQLSSRLGGHLVLGHIDQVIKVSSIYKKADFVEMKFSDVSQSNKKLIIKKGSIAINGVSLTVNDVTKYDFSVMLIPHTLKHTGLHLLQELSEVNVEFDMVVKVITNQSEKYIPIPPQDTRF